MFSIERKKQNDKLQTETSTNDKVLSWRRHLLTREYKWSFKTVFIYILFRFRELFHQEKANLHKLIVYKSLILFWSFYMNFLK